MTLKTRIQIDTQVVTKKLSKAMRSYSKSWTKSLINSFLTALGNGPLILQPAATEKLAGETVRPSLALEISLIPASYSIKQGPGFVGGGKIIVVSLDSALCPVCQRCYDHQRQHCSSTLDPGSPSRAAFWSKYLPSGGRGLCPDIRANTRQGEGHGSHVAGLNVLREVGHESNASVRFSGLDRQARLAITGGLR